MNELPIADLHAAVDAAVAPLVARHAERLQCARGCADCCVDGITVWRVEAERIRSAAPELLAAGEPHPEGRCAFLDADLSCRIYAVRPYVCRTQGLPLRWIDHDRQAELRDVCPLNEGEAHAPIETLSPDDCWTLGPVEGQLATLEANQPGAAVRVPLRSLFEASHPEDGSPSSTT